MPGWQWDDRDIRIFAEKCRKALGRHERAPELTRSLLVYLSVCGWSGRALESIKDWTQSAPQRKLRALLMEFDDPDLRAWVEKQVGFPDHSSGFGER